jgi:PAS domain S-box-containing protein
MVQHQRSQILDIACQRADGTLVPVDITATVINLNGDLLVQGIFRDVSERKAAAQALQESRQFLQTVLDTVPLGVFWKR